MNLFRYRLRLKVGLILINSKASGYLVGYQVIQILFGTLCINNNFGRLLEHIASSADLSRNSCRMFHLFTCAERLQIRSYHAETNNCEIRRREER